MKSVFFTGHRIFKATDETIENLVSVLIKLILEGASDFYAGGALGWDMLCEKAVLGLREKRFPAVKLHLVLPCPPEEQTARWNYRDREEYRKILVAADSVETVSEHYDKGCMKKRNERLAELGDVCVCCYDENNARSGTGQTVRIAENSQKEIINILRMAETYKK